MYLRIKRIIDFFSSLVIIIFFLPIFIVIVIGIKLDSRGPIFFRQKRFGINKSHFNIIKFRTMKVETPQDTPTHLLDDSEKFITRTGRILRKTSLDELPQIFNILKGEMSLVGPRPALWNQYDLIEEREKYGANNIPVGLTGWAQVNGRDELPISEKAKLDGEYANRIGILTDICCVLMTIFAVLGSRGVVEGKQKKY